MRSFLVLITLLACFGVGANTPAAADWGDLTLTFKYEGTAPAPQPLNVNKDQAVCGQHKLVDESLVVNKENGGIRDVIVYLYVARGGKQPPVHPDFSKTANDKLEIDNKNCRFDPHVQFLRTTQSLVVLNSDSVGHNTNFSMFTNPGQNVLIPAGGKLELNFSAEERLPSKVACNIHPWMSAFLVVRENPYMGASDENGKLTIKNVPTGKWTFQFWQEKAGYVDKVKEQGKAATWRRGRREVTIKAGTNDLGEISLSSSLFK